MPMVGLFWITGESVHLGAPPSGLGPGVLVTEEGLTAVGDGQTNNWAWADLKKVTLLDAPIRSSLGRRFSMSVDAVLTAAFGGTADTAPAMTVRVETADGATELSAPTAAAGGYEDSEFALSQALLNRFAEGSCRPSALLAWGRTQPDKTPGRTVRETLLREWAGT
ncbi:hypothetical protein [Streptomyces sporangiiformans]|uniref:Uncharacterized protein n=1 Tax=Streptomyces sporangiiformans TaxID=2315329 RepID=A0A505DIY4_9ACTN|nr:hypothetical protein [Streptomyces sporangiiformans]TPQ20778.1 hypothetical protein FGD71_018800 [Streptomyces sporangiiformans]